MPELYVFDFDGTLRYTPGKVSPTRLGEQQLLPSVRDTLLDLKNRGHTLAGASNQGGVGLNMLTPDMSEKIAQELNSKLNGVLDSYQLSFYHPKTKQYFTEEEKFDRKPSPGMLIKLIKKYNKDRCIFVGDLDTDEKAIYNLNRLNLFPKQSIFIYAKDFFKK